ncbi:hypothetical protein QRQ56_26445 [Bradyrhizobium sp. U531]|uniref:hypothetical protein n=1 Tax=Bradyrhizobium sp. U531 TaxID=3053458 RepID=UPI003F41E7C8
MNDRAMIIALNELADTLNEAAAKLDAISRSAIAKRLVPSITPGSQLARMVEQCDRAAAMMPEPREPTKWDPTESC